MFARINTIVQKVKGVKDTVSDLGTQGKDLLDKTKTTVSDLGTQGKDLLDKTKAAYQDVTQDGLGMDDLAKIGGHVQDLAKGAGEAVMQAKDNISNIVGKKQEPQEQEPINVAAPKKATGVAAKKTTAAPKKATGVAAKKTTKPKATAQ